MRQSLILLAISCFVGCVRQLSTESEAIEGSVKGHSLATACKTRVLSFQQGTYDYTGAVDTEIRESRRYRDLSYENSPDITVNANWWTTDYQALIRFENIFGESDDRVPFDGVIVSAQLVVYATDGTRNSIALHQILRDWAVDTTWNEMNGGVSPDDQQAAASPDSVLSRPGTGETAFDVKPSVTSWQSDPLSNHGWAILNSGSDRWRFRSSENDVVDSRPRLIIEVCMGAADPCEGVVCDMPPGGQCVDAKTRREYSATGECIDGVCEYPYIDSECVFGCSNGGCNPNTCDGVACEAAPASTCVDAETLRTYDQAGTCIGGICEYPFEETRCIFGCENGACNPDPCDGVICDAPPSNSCVGDNTLRTYNSIGACTDGVCEYQFGDSQCVFGCENGTCNPDPCSGIVCDEALADSCVDSVILRTYDPNGTCDEGLCEYPYTDSQCAFGCYGGFCNPNPCDGVICDAPPANTCVESDTIRIFNQTGTCNNGECEYAFVDSQCELGCDNNACNLDPCDGVLCDTPPDSYCFDADILRRYQSPGTCVDGTCEYTYIDGTCELGCIDDACDLLGYMNFWFGNLHSHTEYSDGRGTPAEAYLWARDDAGYDFYVVSDHAKSVVSAEWADTIAQADAFNRDDVFVAIHGFEWTHSDDGHVVVFNTSDYTDSVMTPSISELYAWIEPRDALAQFNHPGREANLFDDLVLNQLARNNFFAIETGNKNVGNSDGTYMTYYPYALEKGWRVAPTNNQDNHRLQTNSHRSVVIAPTLTRVDIIDAMRNRRIYSSDDPNIEVVFKLGINWMGSEVQMAGQHVRFSVRVDDDEPIEAVELRSNGGVLIDTITLPPSTTSVLWEPELQANNDYYYVQVVSLDTLDSDGPEQFAITAPIWFD